MCRYHLNCNTTLIFRVKERNLLTTCESSQRVSQCVGAGDDSATTPSTFTWKKIDDDIQLILQ